MSMSNAARKMGKKGGRMRDAALSPKRKQEIAASGGKARRNTFRDTREALKEVLDGLGALSNPSELTGWAISLERAAQIVSLAKGKK